MELTGKCKGDFEKWYIEIYFKDLMPFSMQEYCAILACFEDDLESNMKYGVYVDFFDSVGIRGYIYEVGQLYCTISFSLLDGDVINCDKEFDNRNDARIELIQKANEIYNER